MSSPASALPPDLSDEIASINAIYGDNTLILHAPPSTTSPALVVLQPPASHPLYPTALLLSIPPSYPATPATVAGVHRVDPAAPHGAGRRTAARAQAALTRAALPGEPCVFALLAELEAEADAGSAATATATASNDVISREPLTEEVTAPPTVWVVGEPIESHRSVFVGRAVRVTTAAEVAAATAALVASDRHVAKATHNIRAWRLSGRLPEEGAVLAPAAARVVAHQESDDDGETRAGTKVLEVMAAMGAWDVLVVVSRWYGGVKLGPERFRLIGQCARDTLVRGGWGLKDDEGKRKKPK